MRQHNLIGLNFVLLILCTVAFGATYAAEEKEKPKGPPQRATPVVTASVSEVLLAPTIKVPGTIVSRQQAEVPAEVEGKLIRVSDIGISFRAGDVVAKLDDTLYQLQASANKATLNQKKKQLEYLEKELARLEELEKSDFSSKTELDKLRLERDLANSELVVATAKVKLDEETLSRYVIRAPFDGQIIERHKREGEWIKGGEKIVTLSNPDKLEIEARVSESSVRFIKAGDVINVVQGDDKSTGTVRSIVAIGDIQSHLFDIRIDLKITNWFAGQTVKVEVPTGRAEQVLAVPRDALILRRGGISIYKIDSENKSQKVEVTAGIASSNLIQVKGDVKSGDVVVIRGSERLRPGQEVSIIPGKI